VFVVDDTPAWQEVSRTRPVVTVVFEGEEERVCYWCFACTEYPIDIAVDLAMSPSNPMPKIEIKRCSGCKTCGYCSKACQQKAWNLYHKAECKTRASLQASSTGTRAPLLAFSACTRWARSQNQACSKSSLYRVFLARYWRLCSSVLASASLRKLALSSDPNSVSPRLRPL
jgi:Pyruvate/2-oxoacid:ferredoxin oxidoreductase delta subunit